ncbi:MAG TPA: hypothetical protein VMS40_10045 [Vicinamibacterales bacterium]|nr:hypothetical protein [Vicinamibacterales bacterium]
MRGFLVLFDTQPTLPASELDTVERQLALWTRSFPPASLREASHPRCRFFLYTHSRNGNVPAELNQKLVRTPDGTVLWTGPRVDMTADDLLRANAPGDLPASVDATRSSPGALDTAICVRYRTVPHSLIVKTDVINSTFVYWTQSGRWVLVSNSSLTLARITGASVDPVAAAEFLASGSIYGNRSLYKDIGSFRPATLYSFTESGVPARQPYWTLDTLPFETLAAREACDRVVGLLDADFADLNATGKTFILDLTGGYDSRTNLGFAVRQLKNFETTVTGVPEDEDVTISSALAKHFGIKHTVISPIDPDDDATRARRLADSALLTDLEYDLVEYSRIYRVQTQFDTLHQPSIHGSGGGDIARNIILRSEFCDPDPDGKVVLESLINSRFKCAIPVDWSLPDVPIADWLNHMRGRIAEYDVPGLPAFARLDVIYLRMRMQFWQSRIASSTNRFRSSFSPWTNRRVLEAMLTTRWRERRNQMLSRLFIAAQHRDLTRFVAARGEPGGPDLVSAIIAAPARLKYYAKRVAVRLGRQPVTNYVNAELYRGLLSSADEILARIVKPEAVAKVAAAALAAPQPQLLGRLVALAHVKRSLDVQSTS